jgi:hypothetical protein
MYQFFKEYEFKGKNYHIIKDKKYETYSDILFDEYGFKVPDELIKSKDYDKYLKLKDKVINKDKTRIKKWELMLLNTSLDKPHKKLKSRILKGIPREMRARAWKSILPINSYLLKNKGKLPF